MTRVSSWRRAAVVLTALGLIAVGCGDDDKDAAPSGGGSVEEGDLTSVCPDPLIVQTDWFPEPEHGGLYQLIGVDGEQDGGAGVYSGPLGDTGITLEIRAGGPFLGGQTTTAQMYADQDIFMGYIATDEALKFSAEQPTIAVVSPLEKSPQIIMWDPEAFPDVKEWEDVKATEAPVLYFEGSAYMEFLVGTGLVDEEQADASYDGSPTRFVTEEVFQQGFSSNEPFAYENDIDEWKKPVEFLYVADAGFDFYPSSLSVLPDRIEEDADCLKEVVPLMQQAQVDYMAEPKPINDFMLEYVEEMASFWHLSEAGNENAVKVLLEDDLVSNGPDDVLGNFDLDRVTNLIDVTVPVFEDVGVDTMKEDLTAEDLVTNEFIDDTIGL